MFASGGVEEHVLDHFLDPLETDMVIDTLVYDGKSNAMPEVTLTASLVGGEQHEYVIGTVSLAGEGERSAVVTASTSPAAVTSLTSVSQTTSGIELEWSAPLVSTGSAVIRYIVYQDDGAGGAVESVVSCESADALSTVCSVSGLTGGLEYVYAVSAVSAAGEGDRSGELAVSTAPAAVAGLDSTLQTTSSISLSWDALVASGGEDVTGYKVYRTDGSGGTDHSIVGYDGSGLISAAGIVLELEGGREYSFVASGLSLSGEGDVSAVPLLQSTSPGAPTLLSSV
jgi:hypothetical protein